MSDEIHSEGQEGSSIPMPPAGQGESAQAPSYRYGSAGGATPPPAWSPADAGPAPTPVPSGPSPAPGWVPPPGTAGGWIPPSTGYPAGGYGPSGYAAHGTGYPAGVWAAAPAAPPSRHRARPYVVSGALVAVAALVGVAVGHTAWTSGTSNTSAFGPAAGGTGGSGTGGSGTGGSGSGGSGGSGNGAAPFSGGSGGSTSSASGGPADVSAIASGVDPGLVDINTSLSYQGAQAAGTGMVVTADGEVITNNHVINGATTISATDVGNGKTYSATVVGYDKSHDIAVLQLRKASGLQTVSFSRGNVATGQAVVAIGNAGGAGGTPSAAGGSVTALDQSITASDQGDGTSEQLTGLIQVNANIQPGDSGGPLVSSSGKVVGIDTAASAGTTFSTGNASQGYAIPIAKVLATAQQILAHQSSSTVHIGQTAFLGVEVSSGTGGGSGSSGLGGLGGLGGALGGSGGSSTPSQPGATIVSTVPGGSAAQAGLAAGDVITGLGGRTVSSPAGLTQLMIGHHPGDSVQIQWTDSSGQQHTGTVVLASGPPQ